MTYLAIGIALGLASALARALIDARLKRAREIARKQRNADRERATRARKGKAPCKQSNESRKATGSAGSRA